MTLGFAILCLAVLVGTISACVLGVLLYRAAESWYWERRLRKAVLKMYGGAEPARLRMVRNAAKEQ